MERIRLPLITTIETDNYSFYGDYSNVPTNVIVKKKANGTPYIVGRPNIVYNNTGGGTPGTANRGAHYWSSQNVVVVANDDELYTTTLATAIPPNTNASALSSSGHDVQMCILNGNLFVIDAAGNHGKWLSATSGFYDMDLAAGNGSGTFTYFPPNNSLTLTDGCAVIDRTMYVMTTTKQIWGSDLNDGTSWTSGTNYITVEKYDDTPVLIDSHNNHVVYFGDSSIQFFYDAGNATGSPLSLREDISYRVGLISPEMYYRVGDVIYFIGQNQGRKSLYKLENFQLQEIPNNYLGHLLDVTTYYTFAVASFTGNTYIIISPASVSGNYWNNDSVYSMTLVYHVDTGFMYKWAAADDDNNTFPVVDFAYNDYLSTGYLYFRDGDYATWRHNACTDYDADATTETNMAIYVKLPAFDNDNNKWKFFNSLEIIGEEIDVSTDVTVTWRDENTGQEETAEGSRTLDINKFDRKIKRMGRAKRRSYGLSLSTTNSESRIALEAIEIEFDEGET